MPNKLGGLGNLGKPTLRSQAAKYILFLLIFFSHFARQIFYFTYYLAHFQLYRKARGSASTADRTAGYMDDIKQIANNLSTGAIQVKDNKRLVGCLAYVQVIYSK